MFEWLPFCEAGVNSGFIRNNRKMVTQANAAASGFGLTLKEDRERLNRIHALKTVIMEYYLDDGLKMTRDCDFPLQTI